ncbi:MAG: hypothetical protein LGL72_18250, partial [Acidibrevibacterium sp.]|uniref:hypothetical protein n=1 Tax=Acidibrevibacterium fodinaquatile TaxID=1969806 RepID=UPI0023A7AD79
ETVALVDPRGEGIGWTTKTARAEEVFIRESAKRLAETSVPALNAAAQRLLDAAELSDEQRQAAARMTTRSAGAQCRSSASARCGRALR